VTIGIASDRTLRTELEQRVQAHPERTWLTFEAVDGSVTAFSYGAFLEQVYRASNMLIELGVRPSDRILLHLANSPEFLLLWFAAATMGATIVPTNPLSADAELAYLCGHAEATLIVVAPDAIERAERLRSACPTVRHVLVCGPAPAGMVSLSESLSGASTRQPIYKPRAEDEVAVLYTSGTTSRPKGCLITNANYVFAGEAVGQHIGITPTDRLLVVLPYFHANAQYYSTMPALLAGGSLIVAERFSASRYFSTAARHGATLGSLFAAPMRMLLAQPETAAPPEHQLRLVIFAQNVTAAQLGEWERRFHAPLMQIYGMTEQLGQPLANPLHGRRDNMTVGRATLAFRCRVIDDAGDDVGDVIAGQLLISGVPGVSLMRGYLRDPDATSVAIRDGWLWTGDNVRRREDGFFEFVDRSKDMIKRAGENVAASEVEAVLKEHPDVYDVAVIGVPDAMRDEAIKAFVVLHPDHSVSAEELIAWCAGRLATFRVPSLVEFRTELPRTSVGKIQKHLLREVEPEGARNG
jgi:carnitine-CoA ligase